MSVVCPLAFDALHRTSGILQPRRDATYLFAVRSDGVPTGGAYRAAFVLMDDTYTNGVGLYSLPDSLDLAFEVFNAVDEQTHAAITPFEHFPTKCAYRRTKGGLLHEFFIHQVNAVGRVEVDLSAATLSQVWLGDDGFGNFPMTRFEGYQEFDRALTMGELAAWFEDDTTTPVIRRPWTNTPLLSDLRDRGPHGHDWTAVSA